MMSPSEGRESIDALSQAIAGGFLVVFGVREHRVQGTRPVAARDAPGATARNSRLCCGCSAYPALAGGLASTPFRIYRCSLKTTCGKDSSVPMGRAGRGRRQTGRGAGNDRGALGSALGSWARRHRDAARLLSTQGPEDSLLLEATGTITGTIGQSDADALRERLAKSVKVKDLLVARGL
jgi:hypothetical protein